jgi:hypothetical protein
MASSVRWADACRVRVALPDEHRRVTAAAGLRRGRFEASIMIPLLNFSVLSVRAVGSQRYSGVVHNDAAGRTRSSTICMLAGAEGPLPEKVPTAARRAIGGGAHASCNTSQRPMANGPVLPDPGLCVSVHGWPSRLAEAAPSAANSLQPVALDGWIVDAASMAASHALLEKPWNSPFSRSRLVPSCIPLRV